MIAALLVQAITDNAGDASQSLVYLLFVAVLGSAGAAMAAAYREIVRGRNRSEKQVDEALPSLKTSAESINAMVASQQDFKGFLSELLTSMARVATAVSALPDDHRKMNERLDSIDKKLDTMQRSTDDLRHGRYADEDREQRRTSRSAP